MACKKDGYIDTFIFINLATPFLLDYVTRLSEKLQFVFKKIKWFGDKLLRNVYHSGTQLCLTQKKF